VPEAPREYGAAAARYCRCTYSYSNDWPLMPVLGGATQLAILPGSKTGCMSEAT